MSEQATEPGLVEDGHREQGPKTRCMTMVSLDDVIEAGPFSSRWQFRSHRRHMIGNAVTKHSAILSPILSNLKGEWQS
jgi:hypothetical protein